MIQTERVREQIARGKLIAILRDMPADKLLPVADALYQGGVRLIECTFDHAKEDCVLRTRRAIEALVRHAGDDMLVGAGTVLTLEEVHATVEAGGTFIISPGADEEVIRETRKMGAVSIPGALTPTEIAAAWRAGAHFVKIFPAGNMGADYIKAIRAPLGHIPMMAVGGVTPESIPEYLCAGICGFCIGGPLLPKKEIEAGNYGAVTQRAREFFAAMG